MEHICDDECVEASLNGFIDNLSDKDRARRYGMTVEQYWHLKRTNGDRCPGCHEPQTAGSLCVDHDHASGRVRGLLCHRCNRLIGGAHDNPDTLRRLADYLERHQKPT